MTLTSEEWLLFGQQVSTVLFNLSGMCSMAIKTGGIMHYETRILFSLKRNLTEISKILSCTICNAYPLTYWYLPNTNVLLTCVFHDSNVRYEYVNIDIDTLPLQIELLCGEIEKWAGHFESGGAKKLVYYVEKIKTEVSGRDGRSLNAQK